jgi:KipI family sensor histidine kinase inhibitor
MKLLELGDGALTLEFGERIDPVANARVMAARDALQALSLDGVTDIVPTWRSLTVHFDPLRLSPELLRQALLQTAKQESAPATRRIAAPTLVPVCFGGEFGPDLAEVAEATGRSEGEIVAALCAVELQVALIGFLPGFPYLGGLPDWLDLPRRATPRTTVPANSFAIAGGQAAIYPWQSPGGWHLLGRTPLKLFDPANVQHPARFAPGDVLRIEAIAPDEYEGLHEGLRAGLHEGLRHA